MYSPSEIDLLIVDDDDEFRETIVRRFVRRGFRVAEAANGESALGLAARRQFDVGVFDMIMPGKSGLTLLKEFRKVHPECEIIMLTGQGTIESAVEAMKLDAFDYLLKPFPLSDLEKIIQKACERRVLSKENIRLKTWIQREEPSHTMIGNSPAMQEVFRLVNRAGPSDKAILIQGESGTGKELVARALHACSIRSKSPMVVINCAALPEPLLESELFGHEKGAFTGAANAKPGLFEIADGGTLFIDEIGEMPGMLQAKLLRVLEDGTMRRVGSLKERRVDIRLLVATNRLLAEEVEKGTFREDLYYRINVMSLELPTLQDREGDAELLLDHFLGSDWEIAPDAREKMLAYDWPGNVRQMINAIDRGKILADDHIIRIRDLSKDVIKGPRRAPQAQSDSDSLAEIERSKIIEILSRERGNKTRTAKLLGIDRRKLYRLIERYEIESASQEEEQRAQ